jgi:hypothetical protein
MRLRIKLDREDDGRWIGELSHRKLGTIVYGETRGEAIRNVQVAALRGIAYLVESGELSRGAAANVTFLVPAGDGRPRRVGAGSEVFAS